MVDPYTPQALERAFWMVGLAALLLGLLGLVGLERRASGRATTDENYTWGKMIAAILENRQATLFFWYLTILLAAILGQDILLEPFGAEAFGLSVQATTRITSLWGGCVLMALLLAGALESRLGKRSMARWGAWSALLGFALIVVSGLFLNLGVFYLGVVLLGVGTGLSTVSNLSLMLDMTTAENVGLFIGAWGMANAASRLVGTVLGGAVRDVVTQAAGQPLAGYVTVFAIEAAMLAASLLLLRRINVSAFQQKASSMSVVERAAMASD
jgi:BCD family chlorophyll transporter-like MFS transporter